MSARRAVWVTEPLRFKRPSGSALLVAKGQVFRVDVEGGTGEYAFSAEKRSFLAINPATGVLKMKDAAADIALPASSSITVRDARNPDHAAALAVTVARPAFLFFRRDADVIEVAVGSTMTLLVGARDSNGGMFHGCSVLADEIGWDASSASADVAGTIAPIPVDASSASEGACSAAKFAAIAEGSATVFVSLGDIRATVSVQVYHPMELSLPASPPVLAIGSSVRFQYSGGVRQAGAIDCGAGLSWEKADDRAWTVTCDRVGDYDVSVTVGGEVQRATVRCAIPRASRMLIDPAFSPHPDTLEGTEPNPYVFVATRTRVRATYALYDADGKMFTNFSSLRVDWTWEGGASAPKAFTSTDERALELVARLASSSDGDDLLEAAATVEFRRNVELAPREAFPVLCGSGVSASFAARHGRGPLKFTSEASIDVDEQERIVVVGAASSTDAGVCGRATVAVDDAGLLGSTTATAVAIFAAVESARVFQEKTPPERHELELGRNPLLIAEGETRTIYVDAFDGAVRRFSAASYEKMSIDVVARGAAVAFVGEGSAVCAQGSGSAADVGGCAGRWAFNVSGVRVGESTLVIKVRETGGAEPVAAEFRVGVFTPMAVMPRSVRLSAGNRVKLAVVGGPPGAAFLFESDDADVAAVDEEGILAAARGGDATVRVRCIAEGQTVARARVGASIIDRVAGARSTRVRALLGEGHIFSLSFEGIRTTFFPPRTIETYAPKTEMALNVSADLGGISIEVAAANATQLRGSVEGRGGLDEIELVESFEVPVDALPIAFPHIAGDDAVSSAKSVAGEKEARSNASASADGPGSEDADALMGAGEDAGSIGSENAAVTLATAAAVALCVSVALCFSTRRADAPKQQKSLTRVDVPMSPLTMNAGLGLPRRSGRRISARRRLAPSSGSAQ